MLYKQLLQKGRSSGLESSGLFETVSALLMHGVTPLTDRENEELFRERTAKIKSLRLGWMNETMKASTGTMPHVDNFNEDELRSLFEMPSNDLGACNKRSKQKRRSTPAQSQSLKLLSSPVPMPHGGPCDEMATGIPHDDYSNGIQNRRRRHSDAIGYTGSRQFSFDPSAPAPTGCAPVDGAECHSSSPRPQWMPHFSEPIEIRSENQPAWRSFNNSKTSYSPLARAASFHDFARQAGFP